MTEQTLHIDTPSGLMETFVAHPSDARTYPAVLLYMDIWGIREELRATARYIAQAGYCCFLPDFYYRFGTIRNEFRDANGRMTSLRSLTPEQQEQVRAPMRKLSNDMVMHDTAVLLDRMKSTSAASREGSAAIGYCMGGRHALLAGGAFPESFSLVASLRGSDLVLDGADSPHHTAARTKAKIYCGFAEHDPYAAPAVMKAMDDEFRRTGVTYHKTLHLGAQHGYALQDRDVFDQAATNRDWMNIFEILKNHERASIGARGDT